jgi:arylsulfatase A-like enzyme
MVLALLTTHIYRECPLFGLSDALAFAEHGLADKWYPHEESIRVPLVIQDPRMPDRFRGTSIDEFTLNIDLAPTLLGAAGVKTPSHMQGRDIAELYLSDDPEAVAKSWRKDFFYEWSQGRPEDAEGHGFANFIPAVFALVRRDYKYFYWPQLKYEQLFHVEVDPLEQHDVHNTTDPDLLARLKARYAELKNLSQGGYRV